MSKGEVEAIGQGRLFQICQQCGKSFYAPPSLLKRKGGGKYCSHQCTGLAHSGANNSQWVGREISTCKYCGKQFTLAPSVFKKSRGHYCSRLCASKGSIKVMYGIEVSDDAPYGKCLICNKPLKGGHRYKYCSCECRGKAFSGPNNPSWRGGPERRICKICGKGFIASRGAINQGYGIMCSKECTAKYLATRLSENVSRHYHGGKRSDLDDKYFRSSWEANYARYLDWLVQLEEIKGWEYEAKTFEFVGIKRGQRFYTPDFTVIQNDGSVEYHEIKGWMDPQSVTKLKRMAKYYPDIHMVLIDKSSYRAIAKTVRYLISGWELDNRNGT